MDCLSWRNSCGFAGGNKDAGVRLVNSDFAANHHVFEAIAQATGSELLPLLGAVSVGDDAEYSA
jgi:hypothetical protein